MWPTRNRTPRPRVLDAALAIIVLAASGGSGQAQTTKSADAGSKSSSSSTSPLASGDDKLDRYLDRLGLDELRMIHLEDRLAQLRGPAQTAAVRRLADLYADSLRVLDVKQTARIEDLDRRIDSLLKAHPDADTPSLKLARLAGEYNRGERLSGQWIADPGQTEAAESAMAIWNRVGPQYEELSRRLGEELEQALKILDQAQDVARADESQENCDRLRELKAWADYHHAWSSLYAGLIGATDSAKRRETAKQTFRTLLGAESPKDVKPDALSDRWMARCALGSGIIELTSGRAESGMAWLGPLRGPETHPDVRDWVDFWIAWGADRGKIWDAVADELQQFATAIGDAPTPGRVEFCKLLARIGYGGAGPTSAERKRLGVLGLRGLLAMGQQSLARDLVAKWSKNGSAARPLGDEDFAIRWLQGLEGFERAEKSRDPRDYEESARLLASALAGAEAAAQEGIATDCRYALAWIDYRRDRFADAAQKFGKVADVRKSKGDASAGDAAWMKAVALLKPAQADSGPSSEALAALKAFLQDYPRHKNIENAKLQLARLDGVRLESVSVDDPDRFLEACRQEFARVRGIQAKADFAPLRDALEKYLALPEAKRSASGTLECLLMRSELDPATRGDLAKGQAALERLTPADPLQLRYRLALTKLAESQKDQAAVQTQADWLTARHPGSTAEQTALIALARLTEARLSQTDAARRAEARSQAIATYQRLSRALGDSPEILRANRNALIAAARLAQHALAAEQHEEAARRFEAILAAYPQDASALRGLGLAALKLERWPRAVDCFQTLLAGLPRGSAPWFEAKHHQITALRRIDPMQARQVIEQLELLYPDLGPDPWREPLLKLKTELGTTDPAKR